MERAFPRKIDVLSDISEFVADFIRREGVPEAERHSVDLVIEEIFTNFVRHNVGGGAPIVIELSRCGDRLTIRLTDFDVEPFDPTSTPDVDTEATLTERRPGGLGVHFVRRISESFDYRYTDRNSIVTITKRIES